MSDLDNVARAIAFFEQSEDLDLLKDVLRTIRPRAAAEVRRLQMRGRQAPVPLDIPGAASVATREEALKAVTATKDFAQLQAISRAVGRRVESLSA
jgi:hypothetical protein